MDAGDEGPQRGSATSGGHAQRLPLRADLASFTGAGYGTIRVPAGLQLESGQIITVTDDEADTLTADVLAVHGSTADIRVHWNDVTDPRLPSQQP